MPYSTVNDLLTGDIPTPAYVDPAKYVEDASKEVDMMIGFRYETPIDVSESSAVSRPARLLLERVCTWLASGRLLMAAAAGAQQQEVHAYANKLVNDAMRILTDIGSGEIALEGAVLANADEKSFTGPQIYNKDAESNVDAFYDRVSNPNYVFPPSSSPFPGYGGLVR